MTPMKRYSQGIKTMKEHFHKQGFCEKTLNSAESQYNPHGGDYGLGEYSKGVINDFSIILNYKNLYAVSLTFNYKEEPVQVEAGYCPYKSAGRFNDVVADKEQFENSGVMTPEEFSQRLNELNKKLELTKKIHKPENLVEIFKEHFQTKKLDVKKEIKHAEEAIGNFLNNKESNLKDKTKSVKNTEQTMKRAQTNVQKAYKATDEYKEMEALRERERELRRILESKKQEIEKNYKLEDKKKAFRDALDDLDKTEQLEDNEKEKALENFPRFIRRSVIKKH